MLFLCIFPPPPIFGQESTAGRSLQKLVSYLLQNSEQAKTAEIRQKWEALSAHTGFQEYLREKGIADFVARPEPEKRVLVGEYLAERMNQFNEDAFLRTRQAASLRRALWFRARAGELPDAGDGYELLAKVSARNLQRLLKQHSPSAAGSVDSGIENLLKRLSLAFVHNTHVIESIPEVPLVSSRVIQDLTGIGGLNTYFFNRRFLHSDDNLFFFVDLCSDNRISSGMSSIYGSHTFAPVRSFVFERGWISAFVMYPYDLFHFAATFDADTGRDMRAALTREFPEARITGETPAKKITQLLAPYKRDEKRWNRFLRNHFDLWNRMRRHLCALDFTVADFETLAFSALRLWLKHLKETDTKAFENIQTRINLLDLQGILPEALAFAYGLHLYFECKIPVALPPAMLRKIHNEQEVPEAKEDVGQLPSINQENSSRMTPLKFVIRQQTGPHCKRGPAACEQCRNAPSRYALLDVDPPEHGRVQRPVLQVRHNGLDLMLEYDIVRTFPSEEDARIVAQTEEILFLEE
jgi:hypothetical protein